MFVTLWLLTKKHVMLQTTRPRTLFIVSHTHVYH